MARKAPSRESTAAVRRSRTPPDPPGPPNCTFEETAAGLMNSFALACACACSLAALLSLGLRVFKFGKYLRFDSARATFWEDLRPALNMPDAVNSLPDRATIATPSGHPNKKGKKGKMPTGRLPGARVKDAEYDKDVGQISRINKVIFVHVPKTGGSTIEQSKLFYDAKKHHPVGGHTHAEKMLPDE